MNNRTIFITAASWEPRFILGAERIVKSEQIHSCVCLWFEEFGKRTEEDRKKLSKLFAGKQYDEVALNLFAHTVSNEERIVPSYVSTWKTLHKLMAEMLPIVNYFILDITTIPREALWIMLDLLTEARVSGKVVYHRAESHGQWCGCEPERPHTVPKLGGSPSLDGATKLIVVSGYDEDRSDHFIATFEPDETLILFQEGLHNENIEKNEKKHRQRFGNRRTIGFKEIDWYAPDWGYEKLYQAAKIFGEGENLVLASLGPKTSAVSLYRIHRQMPQSGLVYSPCKEYNPDYSRGISNTLSIDWIPDMAIRK